MKNVNSNQAHYRKIPYAREAGMVRSRVEIETEIYWVSSHMISHWSNSESDLKTAVMAETLYLQTKHRKIREKMAAVLRVVDVRTNRQFLKPETRMLIYAKKEA